MSTARFLENNFLTQTSLTINKSSEDLANTFSKCLTDIRSEYWFTTGNFTIPSGAEIFINDGSNKTITLTAGNYTGATLASHVQTRLNASSSNWTCGYSNLIFTIARSSSATLRLSETSSVWEILGYFGTTDRVGTSFQADQTRIHTSEYLDIDFKAIRRITAACLFGEVNELLTMGTNAVVRVMGDNLNNFTTPAFTSVLTVATDGALSFFDESYRYWRVEIVDPSATAHQKISYVYLGDHYAFQRTNVAKGFGKGFSDNTRVSRSINGTPYFDEGFITSSFSLSVNLLDKTEREQIERIYFRNKLTKAFILSIDPDTDISYSKDDWTKLVRFSGAPDETHTYCQYMSMKFSVEEVI
jgi:hypothetical protein